LEYSASGICLALKSALVRSELDQQLARFLKAQRGDATLAAFARKLGVSPSTLFRLENLEQSATLNSVSQIMKRLKATPRDVFGDVGQKGP
jgi:transcriptional regulator with XRE-family HTH domain